MACAWCESMVPDRRVAGDAQLRRVDEKSRDDPGGIQVNDDYVVGLGRLVCNRHANISRFGASLPGQNAMKRLFQIHSSTVALHALPLDCRSCLV